MIDLVLPWDLLRIVIFTMFGLTIGQIGWIIRTYGLRVSRPFPRHILTVGVAYIFALTEVAYQNVIHVGEGYTHFIPVNFVIMGFSLYAMRQMQVTLDRRGGPRRSE